MVVRDGVWQVEGREQSAVPFLEVYTASPGGGMRQESIPQCPSYAHHGRDHSLVAADPVDQRIGVNLPLSLGGPGLKDDHHNQCIELGGVAEDGGDLRTSLCLARRSGEAEKQILNSWLVLRAYHRA